MRFASIGRGNHVDCPSEAAVGLHIAATFYFRIAFWYGFFFPLG